MNLNEIPYNEFSAALATCVARDAFRALAAGRIGRVCAQIVAGG